MLYMFYTLQMNLKTVQILSDSLFFPLIILERIEIAKIF